MELFFLIVILAVLFKIGYLLIPSASAKGRAGERRVNSQARRYLDPGAYQLLVDITIPTKSGGTTQIDHIILSVYGIFVVETKNYSGWIFGSPNQRQWTQVIYEEKNRFQNPIRQNYGHICALSEFLGIPKSKFHNVVCFAGNAEFKTEIPHCVQFDNTYVDYIESFNQVLLPKQKLNLLRKRIETGRLPENSETQKMHIKNVHSREFMHLTCPRCGAALVLRTARKGANAGNQFWGCSSYPKCRYTSSA